MTTVRPNQHLREFNAIAHVFWDGEYQDSFPLYRESKREAKKIFKALGWYNKGTWWFGRMAAPKTTVEVDGIQQFMYNEGAITMEEFQEYWGIDLVTWIWGLGPIPKYVREIMGDRWERRYDVPSVVPSPEDQARFEKFYEEYMTQGHDLLLAIEKTCANHYEWISGLFWKMAERFGDELNPHPPTPTILTTIIEILKRGSYWRIEKPPPPPPKNKKRKRKK